jgi:sarcosine oxidase subunit beta
MPALLEVSLTHLVKGYYDMTPDHQPIVGPAPEAEGVWVAAGLSGHGFMMAPAVGRAVADLVRGQEPAWYFRHLGIERFSAQRVGEWHPEAPRAGCPLGRDAPRPLHTESQVI